MTITDPIEKIVAEALDSPRIVFTSLGSGRYEISLVGLKRHIDTKELTFAALIGGKP